MKTALSQIQAPIGYRFNYIWMPQEEMLVKLMSGNIPVMKHLKKRPAECKIKPKHATLNSALTFTHKIHLH